MRTEYPHYLSQHDFHEFIQSYAKHFDLEKDIVFNTTVHKVTRNERIAKWSLEVEASGQISTVEFDKVAFAHGYQTEARLPDFEGQKKFEGSIIHSQQFRK